MMVFQKGEFDVKILSQHLLASSYGLILTRSSTLEKDRVWSSMWLHHKLGNTNLKTPLQRVICL